MWGRDTVNLGTTVFGHLRRLLAWGWLLGCLGLAFWMPSTIPSLSRDLRQPDSQSATLETVEQIRHVRPDPGIRPIPQSPKLESVSAAMPASVPRTVLRTRRIEDIRVGQRVAGSNPLRSQVEPAKDGPEPATWRKVEMFLLKPGGRHLNVVLLRPEGWLERNGVRVGGTVELDLPEMGAKGRADVLAVGPCPPIESGRGNVVTGTFTHEPEDNILDVRVEGLEEPIGVTDTHPFWSEDRQEFVAVGKLRAGERVRTKAVGVVRVTAIGRRPREAWVYNLEVYPEHVYQVSEVGVLVHNDNGTRLFDQRINNGLGGWRDTTTGRFTTPPARLGEIDTELSVWRDWLREYGRRGAAGGMTGGQVERRIGELLNERRQLIPRPPGAPQPPYDWVPPPPPPIPPVNPNAPPPFIPPGPYWVD